MKPGDRLPLCQLPIGSTNIDHSFSSTSVFTLVDKKTARMMCDLGVWQACNRYTLTHDYGCLSLLKWEDGLTVFHSNGEETVELVSLPDGWPRWSDDDAL